MNLSSEIGTTYFPFTQRQQKPVKSEHAKYLLFFFLFGIILLVCSYATRTDDLSVHLLNIPNYYNPPDNRWNYVCIRNRCERRRSLNNSITSLATCQMLCDKPPLWPIPTKSFIYRDNYSAFFKDQIYFQTNVIIGELKHMLDEAFTIFMENIKLLTQPVKTWNQKSNLENFFITINVESQQEIHLKLKTDESYHLLIQYVNENILVNITANTYFGARHGLETLSQLIWWDEFEQKGMLKVLHDVEIKDKPKYPYRGLMIDTARNFFPLHQLKRAVIGMAANKLNVLHLHLTDAVSFPIVLPNVSQLSEYGAYGPNMIFTLEDIEELKEFARIRGVRLLLEVDAPSHVNSGWEFGPDFELGDLVICGKDDHFNGHLNPDNPNTLNVLENVYSDILNITGEDEMFHIGNDEVNLTCWSETKAAENYTDMKLFWANYTSKMLQRLSNANKGKLPENIILWSSPLTNSDIITEVENYKNLIVQYWFGKPLTFLFKNIRVIFSTVGHWYLDCGFGPWKPGMINGVCDPYTPWQKFYSYRPWKEYTAEHLTVGGEVNLWSEQVEVESLQTRLWPRAAAFAERIWSDPDVFNNFDIYSRLVGQRERLVSRGLNAEGMWPRWCSQNPGKC